MQIHIHKTLLFVVVVFISRNICKVSDNSVTITADDGLRLKITLLTKNYIHIFHDPNHIYIYILHILYILQYTASKVSCVVKIIKNSGHNINKSIVLLSMTLLFLGWVTLRRWFSVKYEIGTLWNGFLSIQQKQHLMSVSSWYTVKASREF